jgi:hypothetical protein
MRPLRGWGAFLGRAPFVVNWGAEWSECAIKGMVPVIGWAAPGSQVRPGQIRCQSRCRALKAHPWHYFNSQSVHRRALTRRMTSFMAVWSWMNSLWIKHKVIATQDLLNQTFWSGSQESKFLQDLQVQYGAPQWLGAIDLESVGGHLDIAVKDSSLSCLSSHCSPCSR